ncbi:MAG: lipid II:glycine glycyltransferase FemX [Limisphaerales bacterium]
MTAQRRVIDQAAGRRKLRFLDPLAESAWAHTLTRFPEHGVFHSAGWLRVLQDTYRFTPCHFVATQRGQPVAALPLMEVRSFPGGRRLVSLPFTDHCPVLTLPAAESDPGSVDGVDPTSWTDLWDGLVAAATARGFRTLEVRAVAAPVPGAIRSAEFWGHELDLSGGPDALLQGLDPAVRRALRKSEREGLNVESRTDRAAMAEYYELHGETRQRHGLPPQPYRFFEQIWEHLLAKGQGKVVLARHRGQKVAGAVYLHTGKQAVYKFGASRVASQSLRPNNAVMWHALQGYARDGFTRFDFGRTDLSNEGLRRFKLGWGARESAIAYYKFDLRRRAFVAARDLGHGWHNRVFRLLPLPLARCVGALIYRRTA